MRGSSFDKKYFSTDYVHSPEASVQEEEEKIGDVRIGSFLDEFQLGPGDGQKREGKKWGEMVNWREFVCDFPSHRPYAVDSAHLATREDAKWAMVDEMLVRERDKIIISSSSKWVSRSIPEQLHVDLV